MMRSTPRGGPDTLPGAAGFRSWSRRHAFSFLSSLGNLLRHPVASAMTVVVLAIALTLPTALQVTLDNIERMSRSWERLESLSVFLDPGMDREATMRLTARLTRWPEIVAVDPIDPEHALRLLADDLNISDLAGSLPDNPLPWVLEITPESEVPLAPLIARLEREPETDLVMADLRWLERLDALLAVFSQLTWLLAALFGVGVTFIIANTIRMDIQNRREEIEVMALVGATSAFIRRPFLYTGLWYGLLGGALAWLLVHIGLAALATPIARLGGSYATDFSLHPPAPEVSALLIIGSGIFGVIGSWLVVNRHLRQINP